MGQCLSIAATGNLDLLKERLNRESVFLEKNGFKLRLKEFEKGSFTFLSCYFAQNGYRGYTREDTRRIFLNYMSEAISDLILIQWENLILQKIIDDNCFYFNEDEQNFIYQSALQYINNGGNERINGGVFLQRRKKKIMTRLLEYLKYNNQITIEGFVRFRLKDYIEELQEAIDKATEDFLLEKEYKGFMQMLKYFLAVQKPGFEVIHVIVFNKILF